MINSLCCQAAEVSKLESVHKTARFGASSVQVGPVQQRLHSAVEAPAKQTHSAGPALATNSCGKSAASANVLQRVYGEDVRGALPTLSAISCQTGAPAEPQHSLCRVGLACGWNAAKFHGYWTFRTCCCGCWQRAPVPPGPLCGYDVV